MSHTHSSPNSSSITDRFPERRIGNRQKLALRWIPDGSQCLLDAGCSGGDGTRHFASKTKEAWGIDAELDAITVAAQRYPAIHFACGALEHLPFDDAKFDTIIMTDVFEHVNDELATLNELFRVSKPGATLIISTPHSGLFGWLDPYNYGYFLRTRCTWLFSLLTGKSKNEITPGDKHRHYSLNDFKRLLNASSFRNAFEITKVFRSGCLVFPLMININSILERLFGNRRAVILSKPFDRLAELDYWIPYGALAFNIAIVVKKK